MPYFFFNRSGRIYFVRPVFDFGVLVKATTNGASEMVNTGSQAIVGALMNNVLMRIHGAEAVAAGAIILAGFAIAQALFDGYAQGISPLISYNYGKSDEVNLRRIYSGSKRVVAGIAFFGIFASWFMADNMAAIYGLPVGSNIYMITITGFRIFITGFMFMAYNVFASAMFTAFNNGVLSATIAFCRAILFSVVAMLVMPNIIGLNGVWLAQPMAEILTIGITVCFLKKMKSTYKYA